MVATVSPSNSHFTNPVEAFAHRQFCMDFVAQQDALLQSYRRLLMLFELVCVVFMLAIFWSPFAESRQLGLLLVVFGLHWLAGVRLRKAIGFRAQDVDYAHQQLMLAETHLAKDARVFTAFKIYQDRDAATLVQKQTLFLSDNTQASMQDIQAYFFEHKSKSRGGMAFLLRVPAWLMLGLGAMTVIHHGQRIFGG